MIKSETKSDLPDSVIGTVQLQPEFYERLVTDSTILYTDYAHFGELLAGFGGLFIFDLGSIGQPVTASFVPASRPLLQLRINEIPILDPETHQVDWSWVPVEAISRFYSENHLFSASTIQVTSHRMIGPVPESKITYQTGSKDYDLFDAAFGLRLSEQRILQLGGTIKNYNDPGIHNKYDAIKARIEYQHQLKPGWDVRALYYLNRHEIQQVLPTFSTLQYPVSRPAEKVQRFDYGLVLNGQLCSRGRQDFKLIVHHSRLSREFHDWPLQLYWQNHLDLSGLELAFIKSFRKLDNRLTFVLRRHAIASPELGDHCDWHAIGAWNVSMNWKDRFMFTGGLDIEKYGPFKVAALPSGLFDLRLRPKLFFQIGSQFSQFYPSFRERFQQSGPIKGNPALAAGEFFENYLALRSSSPLRYGIKFAYSSLTNAPAAITAPDQMFLHYTSQSRSRYVATTLDWTGPVLSWLALGGQSTFLKKLTGTVQEPWPDYFANGYLNIRHLFFQHNLDLTVRLGGQLWGPRPAHPGQKLTPVLIPSVRITGQIGAVTLFFTLHNFIDSQYDLIYGYPMRDLTLRWGLTWRFYD